MSLEGEETIVRRETWEEKGNTHGGSYPLSAMRVQVGRVVNIESESNNPREGGASSTVLGKVGSQSTEDLVERERRTMV